MELLERAFPLGSQEQLLELGLRLLASFVLGLLVATTYHICTRSPERPPQGPFLTTLVLLSVLIALVTLLVGDNQARAFSLVGVLAIVRFRTVVEDTRDTVFVIFSVVTGMAAAGGALAGPLMAAPLVLLVALLFRPPPPPPAKPDTAKALLVLRLGHGREPDGRTAELLKTHLAEYRLVGAATARGGAALDVTYAVRLAKPETALTLVSELSRTEGVQSVELKDR